MPRAGRLFRDLGTHESISGRLAVEISLGAMVGAMLAACGGRERVSEGAASTPAPAFPAARVARATELAEGSVPRMLNPEPPFRYPRELYARKVQGNVTLRLHVDSTGHVAAESTTVVQSSGFAALDSAAVQGSAALTFAPARKDGRAFGRSIRFPVHFRHPDAPPSPLAPR